MREINLRRFDLNLLVLFDTIMRERHIGRTAEILGLTQPAISHALAKLRRLLDDPLFVKFAKGMKPTPYAEEIAVPLASALRAIQATLAAGVAFEPRRAQRTIAIGGTDYIDFTLMPPLVAALRDEAPGFNLRSNATSRDSVFKDLYYGRIDFALGPTFAAPPGVEAVPLFSERLVLVARHGHPGLSETLTPAAFADLPHMLVSPSGDALGLVDEVLRDVGLKRRIVLTVSHFLAVPFIIGSSDLVALLAERVAIRLSASAEISIARVPIAVQPWTVGFARLKAATPDPALDWFARLITRVAADL